ncbi:MAG: hypothetical protein ACK443_08160 [Methylococcaceae bacterium]|jgi:hypothetical protein
MNRSISTVIAGVLIMAAVTADAKPRKKSVTMSIWGVAAANEGTRIDIYAIQDGVFNEKSRVSIWGQKGNDQFYCDHTGSSAAGVLNVLTTSLKGNFTVDTRLLTCQGVAPAKVAVTCAADGRYVDKAVASGTRRSPGVKVKYVRKSIYTNATCTATADDISYTVPINGGLNFQRETSR